MTHRAARRSRTLKRPIMYTGLRLPVQTLTGLLQQRAPRVHVRGRLQTLRGDFVDPGAEHGERKAECHGDDDEAVDPLGHPEHVKNDMYRLENDPADTDVEERDAADVAAPQLFQNPVVGGRAQQPRGGASVNGRSGGGGRSRGRRRCWRRGAGALWALTFRRHL